MVAWVLPPKDPPFLIEAMMKRIPSSTCVGKAPSFMKAIRARAVVSSFRLSPREEVMEVLAPSKEPVVFDCC